MLMESRHLFPLKNHNSFSVQSVCPTIYFLNTMADLRLLPDLSRCHYYILGDGSNTLLVEQQAPVIVKPDFKGINITETDTSFVVSVGAGENWHQLVCSLLELDIYGLENLALIPGSVGAAPVQNIGAYGVELSDFCQQVTWFDFASQTIKVLSNDDCQFSYRNSIFKQSLYNQGIIIEVVLTFPKKWQANLSYAGLSELGIDPTAKQVMSKIIALRQTKLPDPSMLPNAGSFFKNPMVNAKKLALLKKTYPAMPCYPQNEGKIKLAAGWLIEQTGLKGYSANGVGVHKHQALVLVNYQSDSGIDIVKLAKYVQEKVLQKFDILLTPEVRMVTKQGEQDFADLIIDLERK